MSTEEKVKGPASYFPSIEKKYGQPIDHWMGVLKAAGPMKHMELVALLKADHEMGPRACECVGGGVSGEKGIADPKPGNCDIASLCRIGASGWGVRSRSIDANEVRIRFSRRVEIGMSDSS
jgi:hypothetical protein